jgi:hypothetical protein
MAGVARERIVADYCIVCTGMISSTKGSREDTMTFRALAAAE